MDGAEVAVGDQEYRGPFGPMQVKWTAYAERVTGDQRRPDGAGGGAACSRARRDGRGERNSQMLTEKQVKLVRFYRLYVEGRTV